QDLLILSRICIPQAQPVYCARHRDTPALHATFDADSSARIVYRPSRQAGRLPLHLSQIPNIAYKLLPHVSLKQVRCQIPSLKSNGSSLILAPQKHSCVLNWSVRLLRSACTSRPCNETSSPSRSSPR